MHYFRWFPSWRTAHLRIFECEREQEGCEGLEGAPLCDVFGRNDVYADFTGWERFCPWLSTYRELSRKLALATRRNVTIFA